MTPTLHWVDHPAADEEVEREDAARESWVSQVT